MRPIAFCEIEPYCQAVLKKHWPDVPTFKDITKLVGSDIEAIGGCDVICGGFPCQDISAAGKGAGLQGERSGLWKEYARLISELKPRWVIVENVAALRSRGLGTVLRDLAALGYDAEWHCIPASAIGALHRRDRMWIVAYPNGTRYGSAQFEPENFRSTPNWTRRTSALNSARANTNARQLAPSDNARLQNGDCQQILEAARLATFVRCSRSFWEIESSVGRVVDGFPGRVDRIKSLGNAVVPQIPEMIGKAIIEHEAECSHKLAIS